MDRPKPKGISELDVVEFLNCFSIPVSAGSLSTAFFFSTFYRIDLPLVIYWLLPTTVWFIYTLDHIFDSEKYGPESGSLRHRIHFRYRNQLGLLLLVLGILNALLTIFFLPQSYYAIALGLSGFVLLYLLLVHGKKGLLRGPYKDFAVALGAWFGMVALPGFPASLNGSIANLLLHTCMIGLNMCNLLIFSYFELAGSWNDSALPAPENEQKIKQLENQIYTGFSVIFLLLGFWSFGQSAVNKLPVIMALLLMLNVLVLIMLRKEGFAGGERYRFWGDLIYMIPLVIWFLLRQKGVF